MRSYFLNWAAAIAAASLSFATVPLQSAAAQSAPQCTFRSPGFGDFVSVLTTDVVGSCVDNEHSNPFNGNVEQLASNGLLYWRPCDNVSAFTNGNVTWLNGPAGVQTRLADSAPFDWEAIASCSPVAVAAQLGSTTAAPQPAPSSAPVPSAPALPPSAPVLPQLPARVECNNPNPVSVRNTDLSYLNRQGVNWLCADAYHAKLVGTDFSGANLVQAVLQESELTRGTFTGAHLPLASLIMVTSSSSKLIPGPNFSSADLRGAKISASKLPYSDFRYADLSNADLSRTNLKGTDLRSADLRGADLSQTDFTEANLTGAYLCGANTTGTIFTRAAGVSTSCE